MIFSINSKNNINKEIENVLRKRIKRNVHLITCFKISDDNEIEDAIISSLTSEEGLPGLVLFFLKFGGVDKETAEFLATSQTTMAYASLNAVKMERSGIKKFEWMHSNGDFCPQHKKLSGKIYSFDDLPIIDEHKNVKGLPGELPNCRCHALPIVSFD